MFNILWDRGCWLEPWPKPALFSFPPFLIFQMWPCFNSSLHITFHHKLVETNIFPFLKSLKVDIFYNIYQFFWLKRKENPENNSIGGKLLKRISHDFKSINFTISFLVYSILQSSPKSFLFWSIFAIYSNGSFFNYCILLLLLLFPINPNKFKYPFCSIFIKKKMVILATSTTTKIKYI